MSAEASAAYLYRRLAGVEARVRAVVDRRRAGDPDPDDRFRGLYIADEHVDRLLQPQPADLTTVDASLVGDTPPNPQPADPRLAALLAATETAADALESAGARLRLRGLAREFDLDDFDVELLLVALAPDLDPRFERLYGYLNDDVSRRRASVGLALELCGAGPGGGTQRPRLGPAGALVTGELVVIEDPDRPLLTRALRVPDRVVAHLLGDDTPDPAIADLTTDCVIADLDGLDALERALRRGVSLCYLRERNGAAGQSAAATALARIGKAAVALDLRRLAATDDLRRVAAVAAREARLVDGGLVAGPVEALAEQGAHALRAFAEAPATVLLLGARTWDPAWSRDVPFILSAPVPAVEERAAIWHSALNGDAPDEADAAMVTAAFRLTPEQTRHAARAARLHADAAGRALRADDLQTGARAQNAAGLERLARRLQPQADWADLVLPDEVLTQLLELAARARHRDVVLDGWHMGAKASRGRGVSALFAGDSGTGKTLSAEVVAGELGLDLYVIDLATVVDKYIGETEKNLDRIFTEADRVNGVLLFDEADALFGKRSEVSDARDRYANVEVAYLLQRMEHFDGVAILTTNLRANLDEAFTRRLDAIVDFPLPEEGDRARLWACHLRADVPCADDLDLAFLARAFKLSGGEIRNIAVTAAYLAAADGRAVAMADLVRATEREYRKLGRLCLEAEFGSWFPVIVDRAAPR